MTPVPESATLLAFDGELPADALPVETTLERELGCATLLCALAVAAGAATERLFDFDDLSLVFMTAVIFVAVRTRMSVAVYAAALCSLAYNFFFIEPRYTLYISAQHGVATVALFLAAALACGRLANRLRSQMLLLHGARTRAEALQQLGRDLTAASTEAHAQAAALRALRETLHGEAVVLMANDSGAGLVEATHGAAPPRIDPTLVAAAMQCWRKASGNVAAIDALDDRNLSWHCLPLLHQHRALGVVAIRFPQPTPQLPLDQASLAEAVVRDLGQALGRLALGRELEATRLQAETERLRAALLSSVSHDLRTPLSTIIGSAESLDLYRDQLSAEDQAALARDILGEGQRLDRYIQNLLDMTRLGHGQPIVEREWIGSDELLGAVMQRLIRAYPAHRVALQLPSPSPMLRVNAQLLEQALFNVLDNAAKFAPPDAPIVVRVDSGADRVRIAVDDPGPGIPECERDRVFDMFYRVARGDRSPSGAGLGLAISRAILRAHGGDATAQAGPCGRGTTLELTLPIDRPPADSAEDD